MDACVGSSRGFNTLRDSRSSSYSSTSRPRWVAISRKGAHHERRPLTCSTPRRRHISRTLPCNAPLPGGALHIHKATGGGKRKVLPLSGRREEPAGRVSRAASSPRSITYTGPSCQVVCGESISHHTSFIELSPFSGHVGVPVSRCAKSRSVRARHQGSVI